MSVFEERIIAFIDILGFRSLVGKLSTSNFILEQLLQALKRLQQENYNVPGKKISIYSLKKQL